MILSVPDYHVKAMCCLEWIFLPEASMFLISANITVAVWSGLWCVCHNVGNRPSRCIEKGISHPLNGLTDYPYLNKVEFIYSIIRVK